VGGGDIVGDDEEIVGDDEEAMIREMVSGAGDADALAARMKMLRNIDPQAVALVQRRTQRRRRQMLGMVSAGAVAVGASALIQAQPQRDFRVERITIPSSIASSFLLDDAKVGQNSQFIAAGSLPGETFTEVAIDNYVHFDTANLGNLIFLAVTNVGLAPVVFRATLLGTSLV
jgi:hypothetical protein